MGKLRKRVIAEQRIYDDPQHPETSNYDVTLPRTVPRAVHDPETGETLDVTMARVSKTASDALAAAEAAAKGVADINEKIESGELGGGGTGGGGNTIKITFEAAFAGQPFTVTDGDETYTGTVPEGLVVSVKVNNCNSTYTIKATSDNGVEYSTRVVTGAFYGQYTATLAVFTATINVTAVAGAEVTAVNGGSTFSATADSSGVAAVQVNQAGTYTVTATKDGVSSNHASVTVERGEEVYTAAVRFIMLTVTSPAGSVLTIRRRGS